MSHTGNIVLGLILLLSGTGLAQDWHPEKSEVVIVGVLRWASPSIPAFSDERRQDEELARAFQEVGVPADQVHVLLDEEATLDAILAALRQAAARVGPEGTLVVYYAGHGVRDAQGEVRFLNYDWIPQRALTMPLMAQAVQGCRGRVILLGDCCFSGALSEVVEALSKEGTPAVSLASATGLIPSQADWTFTMTVIDGLRGERIADPDIDRKVTLGELAQNLKEAMFFYEHQAAGYTNGGVPEQFALSYVTTLETRPRVPGPFQSYQWVQVWEGNSWRPARVVGHNEDGFLAQVQDYNEQSRVRKPLDSIRPFPPTPTVMEEEEARKLATVEGKYADLLIRIEVESDYLNYLGFRDFGYHEATDYGAFRDLPEGYWVYVYPHWYIWGRKADESTR